VSGLRALLRRRIDSRYAHFICSARSATCWAQPLTPQPHPPIPAAGIHDELVKLKGSYNAQVKENWDLVKENERLRSEITGINQLVARALEDARRAEDALVKRNERLAEHNRQLIIDNAVLEAGKAELEKEAQPLRDRVYSADQAGYNRGAADYYPHYQTLDSRVRELEAQLRQSQQAEQALSARLAQEGAGQPAASSYQSPWHRLSVQHQRRADELERQVQQLEVQLREAATVQLQLNVLDGAPSEELRQQHADALAEARAAQQQLEQLRAKHAMAEQQFNKLRSISRAKGALRHGWAPPLRHAPTPPSPLQPQGDCWPSSVAAPFPQPAMLLLLLLQATRSRRRSRSWRRRGPRRRPASSSWSSRPPPRRRELRSWRRSWPRRQTAARRRSG
jgi:hypothetical protein